MIATLGEKDTAKNIRETGEFVVCGSPTRLIREINRTAVEFTADVDEFDAVGLTREPSERVAPPRVLESPFALECRCVSIQDVGNAIMLLGEVVLIAVDPAVMEDNRVRVDLIDPIARLSGSQWSTIGEIVDLPRLNPEQFAEGWAPPVHFVTRGKTNQWMESEVLEPQINELPNRDGEEML